MDYYTVEDEREGPPPARPGPMVGQMDPALTTAEGWRRRLQELHQSVRQEQSFARVSMSAPAPKSSNIIIDTVDRPQPPPRAAVRSFDPLRSRAVRSDVQAQMRRAERRRVEEAQAAADLLQDTAAALSSLGVHSRALTSSPTKEARAAAPRRRPQQIDSIKLRDEHKKLRREVFALRDEIERHVQGIELLDERIMDQEMELDTTAKLRGLVKVSGEIPRFVKPPPGGAGSGVKSRSLGADDERVHYTCCVSQLNTFRAQLRAQELLLNLQIQAKSLKERKSRLAGELSAARADLASRGISESATAQGGTPRDSTEHELKSLQDRLTEQRKAHASSSSTNAAELNSLMGRRSDLENQMRDVIAEARRKRSESEQLVERRKTLEVQIRVLKKRVNDARKAGGALGGSVPASAAASGAVSAGPSLVPRLDFSRVQDPEFPGPVAGSAHGAASAGAGGMAGGMAGGFDAGAGFGAAAGGMGAMGGGAGFASGADDGELGAAPSVGGGGGFGETSSFPVTHAMDAGGAVAGSEEMLQGGAMEQEQEQQQPAGGGEFDPSGGGGGFDGAAAFSAGADAGMEAGQQLPPEQQQPFDPYGGQGGGGGTADFGGPPPAEDTDSAAAAGAASAFDRRSALGGAGPREPQPADEDATAIGSEVGDPWSSPVTSPVHGAGPGLGGGRVMRGSVAGGGAVRASRRSRLGGGRSSTSASAAAAASASASMGASAGGADFEI